MDTSGISKKASVVDIPRLAGQADLLGLDNYAKALTRFVKSASTPLTIAIQGEWGSGKTSMMNQLQSELCDSEKSPFYGIWLNTWQYALLSDENVILSRIVSGLTDETIASIQAVHPEKFNKNIEKVKDVTKAVFRGALKFGASHVAGSAGSGVVDEVFDGDKKTLTVNDLRDKLEDLVTQSVTEDQSKDGFIFFIDDLDRIEPIFAVQILELLKNIFNIPHCLFVLAIDYDVVVKGLEPKFGKLTEKNEREFRSFFDKIIQLPFSMPVGRYVIDEYIIQILDDVDYLTATELKDDDFKALVSQLAEYSVGRNPRALKRLTNSLSLIKIFNDLDPVKAQRNDEPYEKALNIGLICCQIAYPFIYRLLGSEPDFKSWNEATAMRLRLKPLEEGDKERLSQAEEFDEEWEQVLYRACQRDPYLSKNATRVSTLLNLLADQVSNDTELGAKVEEVLALSSVTSVEAQDAGSLVGVSKRSKFSGLNEFLNELDPKGQNGDFTSLVKLIHDDVRETYPGAEVSYSKTRIAFSDPEFPRRKKGFLVIRLLGRLPIHIRIDRKSFDEPIPEGASEDWYKKSREISFAFQINSPEDYNQSVRDYIRRNYDQGVSGFTL